MMMFLALRPMEFMFLKLSDLLEHLAMLLSSIITINCLLRNFPNKGIGIINFAIFFADTMMQYLNSILDLNFFCTRGF